MTYVTRVWETLGGSYLDQPSVDVPMGTTLATGSITSTVTVVVPCPVANGAMMLLVRIRDGAGNSLADTIQSTVWVRDTLPPVTVAALAHPEAFFLLQNTSVTNASVVPVAVSSNETPHAFNVVVAKESPPASLAYMLNATEGQLEVTMPWDGPLTVAVVRHFAWR